MAKRRRSGFRMAGDDEIRGPANVHKTVDGYELTLLPVAPALLQKIEQSVVMPERPYYEAETAFGTVEKYYHDATTVETEEEEHAWKTYVITRREAESKLTSKANKALLSKGVVIPEEIVEKKFPLWEEEHKWLEIEVPDNAMDKRYHFLTTEIIKSPDDIIDIMQKIMTLIGMSEEDLRAAEDSFRS